MIKIKLFSAEKITNIENEDAELYVRFYLIFNKDYIFTFLIDSPDLSCSGKNPIKLWKDFLMKSEREYVKYLRRYENLLNKRRK